MHFFKVKKTHTRSHNGSCVCARARPRSRPIFISFSVYFFAVSLLRRARLGNGCSLNIFVRSSFNGSFLHIENEQILCEHRSSVFFFSSSIVIISFSTKPIQSLLFFSLHRIPFSNNSSQCLNDFSVKKKKKKNNVPANGWKSEREKRLGASIVYKKSGNCE